MRLSGRIFCILIKVTCLDVRLNLSAGKLSARACVCVFWFPGKSQCVRFPKFVVFPFSDPVSPQLLHSYNCKLSAELDEI